MQITSLPIDDVEAIHSRYAFADRDDSVDAGLAESIATIGLVTPIVVHEAAPGERHVVDGVARWSAVRHAGHKHIDCRLLPPETDPQAVMQLHFLAHRARVVESAVSRVRFLDLARRAGVADGPLRDRFLPMVGFDAHDRLVRRCEAVARLPEAVLHFCHEKRFSLKQCVHLTRHPVELLEWIFQWRDRLVLTASIVAELTEHIRDYLRAADRSMVEFAGFPAIREILQSDLSPQERTGRLRQTVRELRFPLLTEVHAAMETIRRDMNLPREIELRWDPALERRVVELRVRVQDATRWPETVKRLASAETEAGLQALLERL